MEGRGGKGEEESCPSFAPQKYFTLEPPLDIRCPIAEIRRKETLLPCDLDFTVTVAILLDIKQDENCTTHF